MNHFAFKRLPAYFKYRLTRPHRKGHGIHSPFLFRFVEEVLRKKRKIPGIQPVLKVRRQLLRSKEKIQIEDMGAGSVKLKVSHRSLRDIIRYSSSSLRYGKLLYHTVAFFKPESILEIGTCAGIGTSFMALGWPAATIVTIEGSTALLETAKKNFQTIGAGNILTVAGSFDRVLPGVLDSHPNFDLVFIDGNHRREAVLSYFNMCISHMNEDGIIIVDDIRWSEGMLEAWHEIMSDTRVSQSLDLFQMGIAFLNPKLKKQHFQIYY